MRATVEPLRAAGQACGSPATGCKHCPGVAVVEVAAWVQCAIYIERTTNDETHAVMLRCQGWQAWGTGAGSCWRALAS